MNASASCHFVIKGTQEAKHKLVKMLLLNYSIVTAVLLVVARSEKDIGDPGNRLQAYNRSTDLLTVHRNT
jgi:hypothetical protein